ncbi:MAG: hypothetical protein MAG794_00871 [Gammaproteobacteria bacterium]|nr:hypothetical protein [Gammaproteobacteria bacterium]
MIKSTLKITVSIGLLVLLAAKLDWREVLARAGPAAWWTLPLTVAIQILIWNLANIRWWLLIRSHTFGHTYGNLLKPTYIGAFFNNLLPSSTGGDLFRIYHIYRQGHGAAVAVSPIVTERVVGLICMVALATVSIFQFSHDTQLFNALRTVLFWLLVCGALGIAIVSFPTTYYSFHGFIERWARFKPVAGLLRITEAAHTYLSRPHILVSLIVISLVMQGMQIVIFLILGAGVEAVLEPTQYIFIVPVILVAASIPVTVGGLGVREAAAITLFTSAGMSQENAAAVSLLFVPVLLLSGLPGLWFFLRMKGHKRFYENATHTDFDKP